MSDSVRRTIWRTEILDTSQLCALGSPPRSFHLIYQRPPTKTGFRMSNARALLVLCQFCIAALSLSGPADAGSFEVSPVRLEFDGGTPAKVLTLRNNSDEEKVVVQARVFKWTQVDGFDVTTPTTDLIVNPPIFTLNSRVEQLVRIGPRDPALSLSSGTELSYRVMLTELPKAPSGDFRGVGVTLNISIPIFFPPKASSSQPSPSITTTRDAEGRVVATVENVGTRNFKVSKVALTNPETKQVFDEIARAQYLLPNSKVTWTFKPTLPPDTRFSVSVETERGIHVIEVKETRIGAAVDAALPEARVATGRTMTTR